MLTLKLKMDNTPLHSAVNTKQIIGSIMPSSEDGANVVIDDCNSETSELNRRNSICSDPDIF